MHIHSFRVGKSYVEFEKDFLPRIFLIGGYNGSGKSFFLRSLFSLIRSFSIPQKYGIFNKESVDMELFYEEDSGSTVHVSLNKGVTSIKREGYYGNVTYTQAKMQNIILFSHLSSNEYFSNIKKYPKEYNFYKYTSIEENHQDFGHSCYSKPPCSITSTGELKRENIKKVLTDKNYQWCGHSTPGVVLMDDLDANLHPDWQYQIIRDLQNWAPQHQYIITTHSYDMCEALTPAHVKEIK